MRVGFIGLGGMGKPMATNILSAGYELFIHDLRREPVEELKAMGAKPCLSPREVAEKSEVVMSMLPYPDDVLNTAVGKDGLASVRGDGAIYIDLSSIDAETMEQVARHMMSAGWQVLSGAVSGVEEDAQAARLVIMLGGAPDLVEKLRPLLLKMCRHIVYTGDIKSAKLMKTATAMLAAINAMGVCEVVAWLLKQGLDPEKFYEVIINAPVSLFSSKEATRKLLDIRLGRGSLKRRPSWMPKDIDFGIKRAFDTRCPVPLTTMVRQLMLVAQAWKEGGYEALGIAAKLYEKLSDVQILPSKE
jgi:3-hydroxyisobutyrate dehydrogenase-like beta-hydroxyacid dehydrogenase